MQQALAQASRTIDVDAAVIRFAFGAHDLASADRAPVGKMENAVAARMVFVRDHFNDLGNYIPAALDQHEIADLQPQARDLIGIVQGGAADSRAADRDRAQNGHRRQFARPATCTAISSTFVMAERLANL